MKIIIQHSQFTDASGVKEHFFSGTSSAEKNFAAEAESLIAAYDEKCAETGVDRESEVLLRFHLSDITNQAHILEEILKGRDSFISVVGQPPANKSRIALEAWHWQGIKGKCVRDGKLKVTMNNCTALWFSNKKLNSRGSYEQTAEEFETLKTFLAEENACVADNTMRTWLYCRDVDNNYAGLVTARNDFFSRNGLTKETHFIASTGIEGAAGEPHRLVKMDSISVPELSTEQMIYLNAEKMLSPTAIYGVSFERATRVVYGDRSHIFISGTASIDHKGVVVHPYDVEKQTHRMLDNIEALLAEGDADKSDIRIATLYLRDIADADIVTKVIAERFGSELPLVVLKAPVCRPAWLVEMECIAVNNKGSSAYFPFS